MDSVQDALLLDEITGAVAFDQFQQMPFTVQELFTFRPMGNRRFRHSSMGDLGNFTEVNEGAASPDDQPEPQFTTDIVPAIFKKKTTLSREFIEDERWGTLQQIGMMYGGAAARTMEQDGADFFNGAFTTSLAEDEKSLCNSAHTNKDGGNSQSNSLTNTLSMTGIKNTKQAFRDLKNYRGHLLGDRMPRLLLAPNEIEETALELARSEGRPDTPNRAANVYAGTFRVIIWDRLTDANAWFMIDPFQMRMNLLWLIRVAFEMWGAGDLDTGSRKVGGYMRYGFGAFDWKWIIGNNPS